MVQGRAHLHCHCVMVAGVWALMAFALPSSGSHPCPLGVVLIHWLQSNSCFQAYSLLLHSVPSICYSVSSIQICKMCPLSGERRSPRQGGLVKTSDGREGSPVAEPQPQPLPHHLIGER